LNVQGPGSIRQTEIHTAEPFVPEPSADEVEVAIRKMKRYKAPGSDLIQAGGETLHSEIHKLIILIRNKEELPDQWKVSTVVPIHKKGDKTDCSNYRGIHRLKIVSCNRGNPAILNNPNGAGNASTSQL
jgi:hypothetical protein